MSLCSTRPEGTYISDAGFSSINRGSSGPSIWELTGRRGTSKRKVEVQNIRNELDKILKAAVVIQIALFGRPLGKRSKRSVVRRASPNRCATTTLDPAFDPDLCLAARLLAVAPKPRTPRFARLGSFEGLVEVQWDAADSWRPASVNLPLPESTRIRTGPAAKVEIELDDSSVFRMAGEGLAELSDYTRLSGGQRITVISLDHGLAYFTGEPGDGNSINLLVPGAQASLKAGSRIRLNALDNSSEIAIVEGAARFAHAVGRNGPPPGTVGPRNGAGRRPHFSLLPGDRARSNSDRWSDQLDKAEAEAPASRLDLNRAGKWITDGDYGTVWQPPQQAGWAPFREGRWIWFQSVGYALGSDCGAPGAGKPHHEGPLVAGSRSRLGLGACVKPLAMCRRSRRADRLLGALRYSCRPWGPLAPGETWVGRSGPPRASSPHSNVTGGTYVSGNREILPASAEDLPKDLLKAFLFTAALPSPAHAPLGRLDAGSRAAAQPTLQCRVEVMSGTCGQVTQVVPPPEDAPVLAEITPPPVPLDPVLASDPVVSDSPPSPHRSSGSW